MNNNIQGYQVKYQDLTDELKSLQGLLVLKNQRLAEEELNLKWFKIREAVLTQKKTELLARKKNLLHQKVSLFKLLCSAQIRKKKRPWRFTLMSFCYISNKTFVMTRLPLRTCSRSFITFNINSSFDDPDLKTTRRALFSSGRNNTTFVENSL